MRMRKFIVLLLCAVSLSCVMTGCSGSKVAEVSTVPKTTDTKVESMSFSDLGEGTWTLYDSMGKYGNVHIPFGEQNRTGGFQVLEDGSVSLTVGECEMLVSNSASAVFFTDNVTDGSWADGRRDERNTIGYSSSGIPVEGYEIGILSPYGDFYGNFMTKSKPKVEVLNKDLNLVKLQIGDGAVVLYNCGYAIYSEEK